MAKLYTSQFASPSLRVDREHRCINGVLIASKGMANDDLVDDQTLADLVALGNSGGIRARFDHPNRANPREVEQSLENLLGEHRNFRIEGDSVRADTVFAGVNVARENTILDLAEKAPHLFGLSIVFDEKPLPKGAKPKRGQAARPIKLYAADFVDIPAANAAGLFAAQTAGDRDMDPIDVYARDGKCYCHIDGKEYCLKHSREALSALKGDSDGDGDGEEAAAKKKAAEKTGGAQGDASQQTPVDAAKVAREAVEGERAYRKMFGTVMTSAGLQGKEAEKFETDFYGRSETDLKFLAQHAIGGRAKALGESNVQESQTSDEQKVEEVAGNRFDEELEVRKMYGANLGDPQSDSYKSARGRHVAAARRAYLRERDRGQKAEQAK